MWQVRTHLSPIDRAPRPDHREGMAGASPTSATIPVIASAHTRRQGSTGCALALLSVLVLVLAMTACGEAPPSAATVLKNAQTKFDQTKSFHFTLTASHLGDKDPLPITSATGDVERPDKLSASATVVTAGFTVNEKLIVIGQQEWITNPLTGAWEADNDFSGFATIFDAQKGVGAILVALQQPATPQSSKANNVPCWKITGSAPASALAGVVGTGATATATQSVPTTVCIGQQDNELYSVTLAGPITDTDTAQTTRTFTLSNFDQPVTIQPPQ